ncbi:MAG TPA: gamma-glutamyltransferase [Acidimicrobiales bacterium]|nr:gamma-glutamyltransferase [Acidimicrobiales bacterium]
MYAPFVTTYAPRGMVCAVDHLAAAAGVEVLRHGGSAADAAIATNAVLAVTTQHMCGMGGDLFALVHDGRGDPAALVASGRAGSGADPERLRAEGHTAMPARGDIRSVPVPGCVDGWLALHERFGRLALRDVLAPARAYAMDGFPASATLPAAVALLPDPADYAHVRRPGEMVRRPGVARALDAIVEHGRDGFYGGAFGEGLLALGDGEYSADDLVRSPAEWRRPLTLDAWGHRLWTVPPPSQGYLNLAGSWIAEGLPLPADPDDPQWAHLLIEAARQAGYDRLDVLFEHADGHALLAEERLRPRRAAVDPERAAVLGDPYQRGGTIYLCAVDSDRMGVSLIQSNANGWGSHLYEPNTGIFLQNRGIGFSLTPGHPAEYGPGRRPPHTLSPALATHPADDTLTAVVGSMGGDAQPQVILQLLARWLHAGQSPGDVVAAGRWVLGMGFDTWDAGGDVTVHVEGHAPPWDDDLRRRGHRVIRDEPFGHGFGHAHMITVGDDRLAGASDPRARGGAATGW